MAAEAGSADVSSELLHVAQEQLRWQRVAALPIVRATLEEVLSTTQLRLAYQASDGGRTTAQIAKVAKSSQPTISRWTRNWRAAGLAYETPEGRTHHLVSLEALGISTTVEDG